MIPVLISACVVTTARHTKYLNTKRIMKWGKFKTISRYKFDPRFQVSLANGNCTFEEQCFRAKFIEAYVSYQVIVTLISVPAKKSRSCGMFCFACVEGELLVYQLTLIDLSLFQVTYRGLLVI